MKKNEVRIAFEDMVIIAYRDENPNDFLLELEKEEGKEYKDYITSIVIKFDEMDIEWMPDKHSDFILLDKDFDEVYPLGEKDAAYINDVLRLWGAKIEDAKKII